MSELNNQEVEQLTLAESSNTTLDEALNITDYENRNIYLDCEITQGSIFPVIRRILQYNREDTGIEICDREPIRLIIFSPGGDMNPALSLIDTIEVSKTPVYTYSYGESSSAALLILMSGHKRYTLQNTVAILHQGGMAVEGTAQQVISITDHYKTRLKALRKFVMTHSNLSKATFRKHQDEEWHLSSNDLLEYGMVDGIINNIDVLIGV